MTTINLPASKSIGARFLIASYFAQTLPADPFFDDNDDLMVLQQALLEIYSDEEPIDYGDSPIDVHASGTALRFVTALCASCKGADYVVTGTPRLCSRPMHPLINVLRKAGAKIECLGENETGPYRVSGNHLKGGSFEIEGNISSQFISALMLVAPTWEKGMKLNFTTPLVSKPYLEMTEKLMKAFDIKASLKDDSVIVEHGEYKEPPGFRVEADWSSASFIYEAVALSGKKIMISDLIAPEISMQGDSVTDVIFKNLGVSSQFSSDGAVLDATRDIKEFFEYDFRHCPDLVLPVAVASLCKNVRFRFTGVANLRLKESDRINSLAKESEKLGYILDCTDDCVEWSGKTCNFSTDPVIETYEDHRVAMAFAMAVFKTGEIRISHPEVVEKSFAGFWQQLGKMGVNLSEENNIMTIRL